MDATKGKDAHSVRRGGAKKGGLDFERGESKPRAVAAKPAPAPVRMNRLARIGGALYLNSDLPRDHRTGQVCAPLHTAICATKGCCGHAYSHMMRTGQAICDECRGEQHEEEAAAFARELGIGDDRGPTIERVRELAHQHKVIGRKSGR